MNEEIYPHRCASNKYSCQGLIKLTQSTDKPTQQALAVEYAKMGFSLFPCNLKAPIKDPSLGFEHGFRDGTRDLKHIARTWHLFKLWKELTGEDLTQESTASALVTCKCNKKGRTQ